MRSQRSILLAFVLLGVPSIFAQFPWPTRAAAADAPPEWQSPYPHSTVIDRITWDWTTRRTAALGSDLWPMTWTKDGSLFAAWGDGGGFGGGDHDGRVALGFARIDGPPEQFKGLNINGGKNPLHPASFPSNGKVGGIIAVGSRIYGWLNTQNGRWPNVDQTPIWSEDSGATWQKSDWIFPKGNGNLKPSTFLQFGKANAGAPADLSGYVYFYGQRQGQAGRTYLGRAPSEKLSDRGAYEFLIAINDDHPKWTSDAAKALAIFSDTRDDGDLAGVTYVPGLKRYLLTDFHKGPGELGIFDGPHPWGPWTTVAYESHWGRMGHEGEGLTCSFPVKWMSGDGLTLWCVFSAYGAGAKEGIDAHDRFNLVKANLILAKPRQ